MNVRPDEAAVRRLFDHASSLETEARVQLLAEVRRADPALFDEVESLLKFHEIDGVLDRPPMAPALTETPARLGAYRIISELGRGGMGVVYEAQQEHPRRCVALKVLRPEIVSEGVIRRFSREAEVLGLLHHPGIAQVYQAGEAKGDDGVLRAFIAMELVSGIALTNFARREKLTVPERLALLAQVADAVDHAHRKGVIHRDLKPGNILVEEGVEGSRDQETKPQKRRHSCLDRSMPRSLDPFLPKILDFGIARLAGPELAVTIQTQAGQVVGTLAYMSPEQAGGDPRKVDTRSDVYSLGAILYELLGGRPPIDLTGTSLTQAVTAIQQIEPMLLGRLNPALRGDVEAIVAKALEKDAARRYASAAEMAADIRRHLADEPVLAHAQTTWYQLRKFARRNRTLVAAAALVALALTGGVIGTSRQWWRATQEQARATQQAERASGTAAFLRKMLKSATPEGLASAGSTGGRQLTVRELLDNAAKDLTDSSDTINALVAADTHLVLAEAYSALTEYPKSVEHARLAHEAAVGALGESSDVALQASSVRALSLANLDRGGEGIAIALPAIEIARSSNAPDAPIVIELCQTIAGCYVRKPDSEPLKAEEWARDAMKLALQRFGHDHERTAHTMQTLAYTLAFSGKKEKFGEAVELDRRILALRQGLFGSEHPKVVLIAKDLGRLLHHAEDYAGSALVLEQHLPIARRVMGPDHMVTLSIEAGLAESYEPLGRVAEALPLLDHAYTQIKATVGLHRLETVLLRDDYSRMLLAHGDCDKAEQIIVEQEQAKAVFGEGHFEPTLTWRRFRLAACRHDLPGMERLAERLRGTVFEDDTREFVEQAKQGGAKAAERTSGR